MHDWGGLDMEVAQHVVGALAAKEANGVVVDIGAEESHSASSPKGSGRNVRWDKPVGGAQDDGSCAKGLGDVGGADGLPGRLIPIHRQSGSGRGTVLGKVGDSAGQGCHRTKVGVPTTAEVDDFASNPIFLGSKFESGEGSRGNIMGRGCGGV